MFSTNFISMVDSGVGFDPDAKAFFTSVIEGGDNLTPTEKTAVNQLVLDLKEYGLWGLFDAMYPFVGSTVTSTKWNLINPLDTNAAFRISWFGGMSFNSDGILGNASNSGGNTYLNPQTLGYTEMCMGIYINQGLIATPTSWYDMGAVDNPPTTDAAIIMGFNNKTTKFVNFNGIFFFTTTNGSYIENLLLGQNDGTTSRLYQNTTQLVSGAEPFTAINQSMGIGCSWRGGVNSPSGRGYSIAFIGGTALDITQIGNLNTSIATFNTTLGR